MRVPIHSFHDSLVHIVGLFVVAYLCSVIERYQWFMLLDVQLFSELLVVADLLPLASALIVLHFVSSFYSGSQPGLELLQTQSLSAKLL